MFARQRAGRVSQEQYAIELKEESKLMRWLATYYEYELMGRHKCFHLWYEHFGQLMCEFRTKNFELAVNESILKQCLNWKRHNIPITGFRLIDAERTAIQAHLSAIKRSDKRQRSLEERNMKYLKIRISHTARRASDADVCRIFENILWMCSDEMLGSLFYDCALTHKYFERACLAFSYKDVDELLQLETELLALVREEPAFIPKNAVGATKNDFAEYYLRVQLMHDMTFRQRLDEIRDAKRLIRIRYDALLSREPFIYNDIIAGMPKLDEQARILELQLNATNARLELVKYWIRCLEHGRELLNFAKDPYVMSFDTPDRDV